MDLIRLICEEKYPPSIVKAIPFNIILVYNGPQVPADLQSCQVHSIDDIQK